MYGDIVTYLIAGELIFLIILMVRGIKVASYQAFAFATILWPLVLTLMAGSYIYGIAKGIRKK